MRARIEPKRPSLTRERRQLLLEIGFCRTVQRAKTSRHAFRPTSPIDISSPKKGLLTAFHPPFHRPFIGVTSGFQWSVSYPPYPKRWKALNARPSEPSRAFQRVG